MIRPGIVQDTVSDLTHPNLLPPHLPQWSRVNVLDKARYPKPFLKDRLQPLPMPGQQAVASNMDQPQRTLSSAGSEDRDLDFSEGMNPTQRAQHLEKSINFLKNQHNEVLKHLHEEIDHLKRENKELQFRIVMMQKQGTGLDSTADTEALGAVEKQEDLKIIFLEEEIRELKKALSDEKKHVQDLIQVLEQSENQSTALRKELSKFVKLRQEIDQAKQELAKAQEREQEEKQPLNPTAPLPYNASLNPLTVHLPAQMPRPPNLKECEIIIRHLQQLSDKQMHELTQLKSDLRDVLYSHKWSPEAFLLAKAYVVNDEAKEQAEASQQGKIPMHQPSKRLIPSSQRLYPSQSLTNQTLPYTNSPNAVLPQIMASQISLTFTTPEPPFEDYSYIYDRFTDIQRSPMPGHTTTPINGVINVPYAGPLSVVPPKPKRKEDNVKQDLLQTVLPPLYPSLGNAATRRMNKLKNTRDKKRLTEHLHNLH